MLLNQLVRLQTSFEQVGADLSDEQRTQLKNEVLEIIFQPPPPRRSDTAGGASDSTPPNFRALLLFCLRRLGRPAVFGDAEEVLADYLGLTKRLDRLIASFDPHFFTQADLLTRLPNSDVVICYQARRAGWRGRDISVEYSTGDGRAQTPSVDVVGKHINVTLAVSGSGTVLSTAGEVAVAIASSPEAAELVDVSLASGVRGDNLRTAQYKIGYVKAPGKSSALSVAATEHAMTVALATDESGNIAWTTADAAIFASSIENTSGRATTQAIVPAAPSASLTLREPTTPGWILFRSLLLRDLTRSCFVFGARIRRRRSPMESLEARLEAGGGAELILAEGFAGDAESERMQRVEDRRRDRQRELLLQVLNQLSRNDRELIVEHHINGVKLSELAARLPPNVNGEPVKENTVKQRVRRARQRLIKLYVENGGDEDGMEIFRD